MGSGELGALDGEAGAGGGEPGDEGPPQNCRRRFSRLISSLRLLAICSGVSGVSLNTEGTAGGAFSGVQWGGVWMGTQRRLLFGREGECSGSKSKLRLRVTQAIFGF